MATAKKRATIKDVAAQAGVSYQTVSRVINNKPDVTDETRRKVQHVIDTLGFRPNLAARSLPRQRSHIIGLIIPYEADYLFRDPNLLAQISGIDATANTYDYNVLLSTAGNSNAGIDAFERFLHNRVADGALVIETASSQAGSKLLAAENYPYVTLGYDPGPANGYCVHSNDREGARQVTQHLLDRGHRRIGLINGPATGAVVSLEERLLGHRQVLAEAGLAFDPALMVYGDYTRLGGQRATEQLLALPQPPTAIFALNDRMAMGAIRTLHAANLRVPEDVAVVGFDDIGTAADFNPPLTTVRLPSKAVGQLAAQMLFDLVNGKTVPQKEIILPTDVIIRQSS